MRARCSIMSSRKVLGPTSKNPRESAVAYPGIPRILHLQSTNLQSSCEQANRALCLISVLPVWQKALYEVRQRCYVEREALSGHCLLWATFLFFFYLISGDGKDLGPNITGRRRRR